MAIWVGSEQTVMLLCCWYLFCSSSVPFCSSWGMPAGTCRIQRENSFPYPMPSFLLLNSQLYRRRTFFVHCLLFLFFTMCRVQVCSYYSVPFPYGINAATNVTRRHRRPEKATKIQACSPLATISVCKISRSSEHVAQKAKLFCYCFFF